MKHCVLVNVLLLLVIACSPKTRPQRGPAGAADYFHYVPNRPALISVHRGGGDLKTYPENCIESFAYVAGQIGGKTHPAIIECDIDLTQDSVMVMMHDATLDRTTTGSGPLATKTYAQLAGIRLKDNFGNLTPYRIPTLEDVLKWGRGRGKANRGPVLFTLDVKRNVRWAKVVELVRKTGSQANAAIITYNATDAGLVHQLAPELMISVTIRNQAEYDRLRDAGVPDNRMLAFVGVKEPDGTLYGFLHAKGIATILGTLGNLDKQAAAKGDAVYREFAQHGADIMSTDRPLEMARVLYR